MKLRARGPLAASWSWWWWCSWCVLAAPRIAAAQVAAAPPVVSVRDGAVVGAGELAGDAGGAIEASALDASCRGFVASRPSAAVRVVGGAPFVRLFAESPTGADLVLVVRSPDGRFACGDDRWGRDPGIDAALGQGVYYVWVGTFERHPARFALTVTTDRERRSRAAVAHSFAAARRLRPDDGPRGQRVVLAPNDAPATASGAALAPRSVTGRTGGAVDAREVAPGCDGWIDPVPDHVLVVPGPAAFVRIFVRSYADTTLVVRRPDGTFECADDTWGANPAVEGALEPGAYAIWVGAYARLTRAPYRLYFGTRASDHP